MTRRCLVVLFLASVCLIFANAYSVQAQDEEFENLLQNPDFENNTDAPWTMWVEGGGVAATKSIDNKESHTGDQSLFIDIATTGAGERVELHQRNLVVEAGQQMTYAFWAKTEPGGIVEGRMVMNHRADPWTSYGSANIKITDEWQEFHTPINVTADDAIAGIYIELRDSAKVMVWFDHFRLYEGEYFEEDEEGNIKIAVDPGGKLASTWASIKSEF